MMYRLTYTPGADFAVAELTALLDSELVGPVLLDLATRTRQHQTQRLLINLLDVPGELDTSEHYLMGLAVAKHLAHLDKVATVVPKVKITRISEEGAQELGMQLRVFATMEDAARWLRR